MKKYNVNHYPTYRPMVKLPPEPTPTEILKWMGYRFVSLRQEHPRKAWTFYRDCLMEFQCELKEIITIESIIERAMRIESFVQTLREVAEKHELSPAEAMEGMRKMLRPKDVTLPAKPNGQEEQDGITDH